MTTDLLGLSAVRAATLIRTRRLSPVEYMREVLAAIERSQGVLNAFTVITADAAMAGAKAAEAAIMRGDAPGPLHGVPVSIKDLVDTAGVRTGYGSAIHRDHVPKADAVVVTRLKQAGAIVTGKTTTPEYGHKGLTDGPSFGVTRNPWHREHTPGGSSGGAAAGVAAGLGPIALGTDGAGSIRLPASCCGIVGLKPTRGAVPHGQAPDVFSNFSYAGPMARTVADAALMFDALIGPDPSDPWSLAARPLPASAALIGGEIAGMRLGYVRRMVNKDVDSDVQQATDAALESLAASGAIVEEVRDSIDWIEEAGRILMRTAMWVRSAQHLAKWRDKMDPSYVAFMEEGRKTSMEDLRRAEAARTGLYQAIQRLFQRHDFLVTPTLVTPALPVAYNAATDPVMVNGKPAGITRTGWSSYLYPFNLSGHPALSVPNGWSSSGLPIGLQIVGRWWADVDCLRLAAFLEEARPWADRRPRHWGGAG